MNVLGMFAKYWAPGQVKTRLATHISSAAAAQLYYNFLVTLVENFARTADFRKLAIAPAHRHGEFVALGGPAWTIEGQADGNLGERIMAFFDRAFREGAERVVLIGSDSPTLPTHLVDAAFAALHTHDGVLGPTVDGGYYLVGAAYRTPPIFEAIEWSTPSVWRQTLARVQQFELRFAELPPWYDVDDWPDLLRLRDELGTRAAHGAPCAQLERTVNQICQRGKLEGEERPA